MFLMKNEKLTKRIYSMDKWDIGLLAVCLGFYLFFPFYDGPVWCADSMSYATMNITREPLYPAFLWVFRTLFGEGSYQFWVVLTQSLIAAWAAFSLSLTMRHYFDRSRILAVMAVFFQFCVTLLCRFVAIRGSSYIDSIMTEGLGLSLFVLFVIQLFRYTMESRTRNLVGLSLLALMLINLRKQMMITLCLMAAVFFINELIRRRLVRRFFLLILLTGGILLASKGTDRFYNLLVRDAFIEHSGNSMGMLCTLVYTAGDEAEALFEPGVTKELYQAIYEESVRQGLKVEEAPRDWVGLSTHYADSYDAIGYGIINPVVQTYLTQSGITGEVEAALAYDRYCGEMVKTLIGQEKGELLRVYASNTLKGFINSIARVHPLLNLFAGLAYLLYAGLYILLLIKRKSMLKVGAAARFGEIVLGAVCINSLVVGAMIFTQPRYMIYSMGLFYLAIAVMAYEIYRIQLGAKKGEPDE